MSRTFSAMLAWFLALLALTLIEYHTIPETTHWNLLDWQCWVLGLINNLLIISVVSSWKRLREGGE